jgi:pyruvate dehydrogenase E2 component (dihydrolipoamide acetyltransferase)
MPKVQPITMPKWGLAMEEGVVARWGVSEGDSISAGQEILDIETTKIANVFESPVAGVLRKKVAAEGESLPVGALIGVVSEPGVPEAEVESFVEAFLKDFTPAAKGEGGAPEPQTVEAGGRRFRYLKAGPDAGVPILLLHGFGADMTTWMFNQAALAEERPVYALDLPGHGGSEKAVGDGSAKTLAAAVLDFMDAAGIGRAHLVGHSLGGAIAVEIALVAPDRVTALTLIAPAGFGREISQEFIEGFIGETRARKLRPVLEMLVADPAMVTGDMVEEVLKFKRLDGAVAALRAVADANFKGNTQRFSLREKLGDIRVPVRIVWGETDRVLPPTHMEGLPPNVGVTRIAGAGHIPHMEKAAEVNRVIMGNG